MKAIDRSAIWFCSALVVALLLTAACRPIQAPAANTPPTPTEAPSAITVLDSDTTARIETAVAGTMSQRSVPGMALCIIKDGQVAYSKGFGVATVGTDKPVTSQSMFQLMDAGMALVAEAVLQLVEQGKVDLDAPITEYLPYFQMKDRRYKEITVRHLLTNSSGLPIPHDIPIKNWEGNTAQYDDGALERHLHSLSDTLLNFGPGSYFSYSKWDYELLGDLIAKVSGQPFEAYMQEHILAPLGMTQSTYLPKQADPAALVSPHMNQGKDVFVSDVATDGREHGPTLGLWSSIDDVCRWMMADLNRVGPDGQRILDDASYDRFWATSVPTAYGSLFDRYGMGWFTGTLGDHKHLTDYGADVGFQSTIRVLPDDKFGIALMTNLWTDNYQNGAPAYGWTLTDDLMGILGY